MGARELGCPRRRLLDRAGNSPARGPRPHARDALVARAQVSTTTARDLARPVPELTPHDTIAHAVEQLRLHRASPAVVRDESGRLTGLLSLDDLLRRLTRARAAGQAICGPR